MSFSVFVTAFNNEDSASISLADVRQRFDEYIVEDKENGWRLAFGDQSYAPSDLTYRPAGEDRIGGFSVNRPPCDIEFWDIIASIIRDYPCVLYWPGTSAVMGSLTLLPHLPKEMIEKLGIPLVSSDGEQIRRYIGENS